MLKDEVIENITSDTRTHKIFDSLDEICNLWDLAKPIWLDSNIKDFKSHSKTKFTKDCFVEAIDFDYLEIGIIEELVPRLILFFLPAPNKRLGDFG